MSPPPNVQSDTPDAIGGNYELPVNPSNLDWQTKSSSYLKREGAAWPNTRTAYNNTASQPRMLAWNRLVGVLRDSGFDDKSKMQIVNAWVNEAIQYDHKKWEIRNEGPQLDWYQTSAQTLASGQGVCSDIARLKYQTLKAAGVDDKNMRLVIGSVHDLTNTEKTEYHELLMVNADGRNYFLNSNLTGDGWKLEHGGVEPAAIPLRSAADSRYGRFSINDNDAVFVPRVSENGQGIRYYNIPWDAKTGVAQYPNANTAPDPQNPQQVCTADSCVDLNHADANSELPAQVQSILKEARDLKIAGPAAKAAPAWSIEKMSHDINEWMNNPQEKQAEIRGHLEQIPAERRDAYYHELENRLDPQTHKLPVDADKREAALKAAESAVANNGGVLRNPDIEKHAQAIESTSKVPDVQSREHTSRADQDPADTKLPVAHDAPPPVPKPKPEPPKKAAKKHHAALHHLAQGSGQSSGHDHPRTNAELKKLQTQSMPGQQAALEAQRAAAAGAHVTVSQDGHGNNIYSLINSSGQSVSRVETHGEIYGPSAIHGATVQDPTINKLLHGYQAHRNQAPPTSAPDTATIQTSAKTNATEPTKSAPLVPSQ